MNEEKIYQYLLGEMNPEETLEFEKELQNDKELQKQLEELNLVIGNIKRYPQHDLKKRLVEIEKNTYKESFYNNNKYLIYALILATVGILLFFIFRNNTNKVVETAPSLSPVIDSSAKLPIQEFQDTTQKIHKEPIKQEKEIRTSPDSKDQKSRIKDEEQLFAAHFEPYVDEFMESEVRGIGEETPYEIFQRLYVQKKFKEAVNQFEKIDESLKSNDNVRFFYANALMAVGNVFEAKKILTSIIERNESRYIGKAQEILKIEKKN